MNARIAIQQIIARALAQRDLNPPVAPEVGSLPSLHAWAPPAPPPPPTATQ